MNSRESKSAGRYWRSLSELSDEPAFRDWMEREFPAAASELPDTLSRRRWIQLMGASLALGGMVGCRWEAEEFAPFTVRPQNRVPGEKQSFATSWELAGTGRPLTVTSIDGRPIKIEGNRQHPFTRGGTDAFDQACILSLYDPDRSTGLVESVKRDSFRRSWEEFDSAFSARLDSLQQRRGQGLAVLSGATSSLSQQRLQKQIAARFPEMTWCVHDPAAETAETAGTMLAFGRRVRTQTDFSKAKVIACFDADPLGSHPAAVKQIRDWADRRDPDDSWMNRLYVFESGLSLTGANADHRRAVASTSIAGLVIKLESKILSALDCGSVSRESSFAEADDAVVHALVDDLLQNRGASVLMAGPHQPAAVHARLHRLNQRLGNVGKTVTFTADPIADQNPRKVSLQTLTAQMQSGGVDTLLVLDTNAAYGTPLAASFGKALKKVPFAVHAGLYRDETARLCRWHVPVAHHLESWSDCRTWDGTACLAQPLIDPLFSGRTLSELLSLLTRTGYSPAEQLVRRAFADPHNKSNAVSQAVCLQTESEWRRAVHDGFVEGSSFPAVSVELASDLQESLPPGQLTSAEQELAADQLEAVVLPDASVFDGRFANNGWLQETPSPITKLTWDNAAVMGPSTARMLGVSHGDVVRLSSDSGSAELPAFILPGVAHRSIQLALGYGRTAAGHVGGLSTDDIAPVGVDVSPLLSADSAEPIIRNITAKPVGKNYKLATTQDHFAIDTAGLEAIGNRLGELIRTGTLTEYQAHPDFAEHRGPHHPPLESLWPEHKYEGHAWGMAIDLNRCIGCNACTVACQSENNVPIVGREQVLAGREMSWLRIDRYFAGDPDEPEVAHQPVACHHCENAPCEQVCPVAATVHSDEGLNDMVYNRCVGTRYCANNCPYKVRRFNFFDYNASLSEAGNQLTRMILNPEVTVRSRGVMEKCTYCVQRIQDTKIDAKNERRQIRDGEIQSACQQACPAQAISFGDLNDPSSAVAKAHADSRAYGMLAELNTKPRTKYLARIRNPHPWLQSLDETHLIDTHANHGT